MLLRIPCRRRINRFPQFTAGNHTTFTSNPLSNSPSATTGCLPQYSSPHLPTFLHRLLYHCKSPTGLHRIHSLLIVSGLLKYDQSLVNQVLEVCFHLGSVEHALSIARTVKEVNLSLQNLVIRRLSDHGLYQELLSIYKELQCAGCGSDNYTFPFLIRACAGRSCLRAGMEVHGKVLRCGYEWNIVILTALVDMYAKCGCMDLSHQVFDGMIDRDLICWNALMAGYSVNGFLFEAFGVFKKIQDMGEQLSVSSFVSIVPVCSQLGAFQACESIHGLGVKNGFSDNENFVLPVISMYSDFGDINSAQKLFHELPGKSVVAWNAMISAYAANRQSEEAFKMFLLMHKTNVRPNLVTFVSILPPCGDLHAQCGESIQACCVKYGLPHQTCVATALLTMYSRLGNPNAAESVFGEMLIKNCLSWNSIMSCYVQHESSHLAMDAFYQMQLEGIKPDAVSMISFLSACAKLGDLHSGKTSHAYILRHGLVTNLSVTNALMCLYSDCGNLPSCIKLLDRSERNLISWNTVISGHIKYGELDHVVDLVEQMQQENVKLDVVTIISVLPLFSQIEVLPQGMSIHGYAIKIGCIFDVSLINALITMYSNCGNMEAAKTLFGTMSMRTVVSWNALMTGHRLNKEFGQVRYLFDRMIIEGYRPNFITLLNALPMCQTELLGKCLHAYAIRTESTSQSSVITSLICMYERFENVNSCIVLFDMADKRNVVVWNTMISVFNGSKLADKAFLSFREMLRMGVEPDLVTILTLIPTCSQLSDVKISESISSYIIRKGFESDIPICNALIDMYCRCGDIMKARKVFDLMDDKDVVSWSVMINGYGIHGDGDVALDLFMQMKLYGVQPDDVTLIGVLSACSHSGLVEEGRMIFASMTREYGIEPRTEHLACMIDLLARSGNVEEAFNFVKKMPCQASAGILESLLGACKVHGNVVLGEKIGRLMGELHPKSSGSYVALSRIYAASGKYTEASNLRSSMDERRVKKIPGFSLIQLSGNSTACSNIS